jgi:hypothetical protein
MCAVIFTNGFPFKGSDGPCIRKAGARGRFNRGRPCGREHSNRAALALGSRAITFRLFAGKQR